MEGSLVNDSNVPDRGKLWHEGGFISKDSQTRPKGGVSTGRTRRRAPAPEQTALAVPDQSNALILALPTRGKLTGRTPEEIDASFRAHVEGGEQDLWEMRETKGYLKLGYHSFNAWALDATGHPRSWADRQIANRANSSARIKMDQNDPIFAPAESEPEPELAFVDEPELASDEPEAIEAEVVSRSPAVAAPASAEAEQPARKSSDRTAAAHEARVRRAYEVSNATGMLRMAWNENGDAYGRELLATDANLLGAELSDIHFKVSAVRAAGVMILLIDDDG
jgi:hypothetical protein